MLLNISLKHMIILNNTNGHIFSGSTALDAIKHNLKTYVVTDASKGTDFNEIENMRLKMIKNGVIVIDSSMVRLLSFNYIIIIIVIIISTKHTIYLSLV